MVEKVAEWQSGRVAKWQGDKAARYIDALQLCSSATLHPKVGFPW